MSVEKLFMTEVALMIVACFFPEGRAAMMLMISAAAIYAFS